MLHELHRASHPGDTRAPNCLGHASLALPCSLLRLTSFRSSHLDVFPRALRDLYLNMSRTTESVIPSAFLAVLRHVVPQFNELDRSKSGPMMGYAQQGSVSWISSLVRCVHSRQMPKNAGLRQSIRSRTFPESIRPVRLLQAKSLSISSWWATCVESRSQSSSLCVHLTRQLRLKCDESPEEPSTVTIERVLKVECNITVSTNYMHTGIMDVSVSPHHDGRQPDPRPQSLNSKLTKNSPSLGRDATYTQTSRLSRIPSYLTLHMVRFAWRRDIGKKAKILVSNTLCLITHLTERPRTAQSQIHNRIRCAGYRHPGTKGQVDPRFSAPQRNRKGTVREEKGSKADQERRACR